MQGQLQICDVSHIKNSVEIEGRLLEQEREQRMGGGNHCGMIQEQYTYENNESYFLQIIYGNNNTKEITEFHVLA